MTLNRRALVCAILIECGLLVLAAFGGPHGKLGGVPWLLQLPGIVFVLYPPGDAYFVARVLAAAILQVIVWYFIVREIWPGKPRQRLKAAPPE